jgi:uncharacterized protein YigE (DUF2233 family)
MNNSRIFILATIITLLSISIVIYAAQKSPIDDKIISYTADPHSQDIALYWKNDSNKIIGSIENLKAHIEGKGQELIFAANGGMFDSGFSPQGLFIQDSKVIKPLDASSGNGNFYLKPNGIFYITSDNKAAVCKTEDFVDNGQIKYATQSGPMLVIDGKIHPAFKDGSHNIHIRNGVGILPDGKVLFAMSKIRVNFYDFANYFKEQGCLNALYLDGFVSRTYLPEKNWIQTDGNFGVIIGVNRPASK